MFTRVRMEDLHFFGLGVYGQIPIWCSSECGRRFDLLVVASLASIKENYMTTDCVLKVLVTPTRWRSLM